MFVIIRALSLLSGTRIDGGHKISLSNQNEAELLDFFKYFLSTSQKLLKSNLQAKNEPVWLSRE